MKSNNIKLLGALAFLIGFSSCSDDKEEAIETTTPLVPLNITASYPQRVNGDVDFPQQNWKEENKLAALRTDKRTYDKSILTWESANKFNGEIEHEIAEKARLAFFHPAEKYLANTNDTTTQTLLLNGQNGTANDIYQFDYLWGACDIKDNTTSVTGDFEASALTGIYKFQFANANGGTINNISQIILTGLNDNFHQQATLDMKEGTLSKQASGSIRVSNAQGLNQEAYIALFPYEGNIHFTLSTTDGKSYEGTTSESHAIEAGSFHVCEPIQCTELALAKIGDYYYDDATWSTELNPAKNCIGIVYALENASGEIDRTATASNHGRIVALKDCKKELIWSLSPGDIEDIANIENLRDTLTQGKLPYFDGTANSFFTDDKTHQLTEISINEQTGQITNWCTTGALSDFDGETNASFINHNHSKYPAASYSALYSEGITGWYLPALGDLALIWMLQQSGIICENNKEGFTNLDQFGYWSSTEHSEGEAWYINFYSGNVVSNSKNSYYNVRTTFRF